MKVWVLSSYHLLKSSNTSNLITLSAPSKSLRLPMPLSAPQQERVARSALYERSKEDVKKWDAVVHSSRAAETKKFPLVKPDLRMATNKVSNQAFRPRNELEEQVMSLLRKSNKAEESSRLSDKEEALLAQMTVRDSSLLIPYCQSILHPIFPFRFERLRRSDKRWSASSCCSSIRRPS